MTRRRETIRDEVPIEGLRLAAWDVGRLRILAMNHPNRPGGNVRLMLEPFDLSLVPGEAEYLIECLREAVAFAREVQDK